MHIPRAGPCSEHTVRTNSLNLNNFKGRCYLLAVDKKTKAQRCGNLSKAPNNKDEMGMEPKEPGPRMSLTIFYKSVSVQVHPCAGKQVQHYWAENKILSKERVVLRPGSGYNFFLKLKHFLSRILPPAFWHE